MLNYTVLVNPTAEDIRQITALYRSEGWWGKRADDPDQVAGIVAGSHLFMVAQTEGIIIGMGRAISDGKSDAYIQDVTVQAEFRGRGIGTGIIDRIIRHLRQDGIEWIGLIAERGSHGFYSRLGFKKMPNSIPMVKIFS